MLLLKKTVLVFLLAKSVSAQFTCTLSAQDETGCLAAQDDDASHCVWCNLSGFGFCVGEAQAEAMEQALPSVQCDRYHDNDDDAVPTTDDSIAPNDDTIPSDFWECLQATTAKDCPADCSWCNNKAGFGLCLAGPAATSAQTSDWFTCASQQDDTFAAALITDDPSDTSCILAFLQDQTEQGCTSAVDEDGQPCEWCSYQGLGNLCLTHTQADMANSLGVECSNPGALDDPYDPSCAMAFFQNQTQETCTSAKDEDGMACEYCTMQGALELCFTQEQADMATQLGFDCTTKQEQEEEMEEEVMEENVDIPDDFWECLENYEESGCAASSCTWCDSDVGMGFCMSTPAAVALKDCTFFQCNYQESWMDAMMDPYDPVCLSAGMQNPNDAQNECDQTSDSQGNKCVWCDAAGVFGLCLSSEQATAASGFLECDKNDVLIMTE